MLFVQLCHPSALQELENVKQNKRKIDNDGIDCTPPQKQMKLCFSKPASVRQSHVDKLTFDYIVQEMRPLSTVNKDSFKALVTGLCPTASVMCRQTVRERIIFTHSLMKKNIQKDLDQASYVSITADLWSSSNRSFLGVTGHWIDEETLSRKSAALACVCGLKGSTHLIR